MPIENVNTVNTTQVQKPDSANQTAKIQTATKPYPNDTVEINGKKKTGMSNGAKVGIGGIIAIGIGVLVYALTKGKSNPKQVLERFEPAKTIKEAKKFANKTLRVEYLDENKANLDMINTINEWLYREKYIEKNHIPEFIEFTKKNIENPLSITDKMSYEGQTANALFVNINYIDKFDDLLEFVFRPYGEIDLNKLINKNSNGLYKVVKPEYRCENLDKLVDKLNAYNKDSTYKNKMEIYDGISEAVTYLNNILERKNTKMADFSSDGPFLHEMGHLLHQDTYKLWNEARKGGSKIYQEFQQADIQNIARQVSNYAKSDPLEFVAETYKRLRRGQVFSDDVMALYKKYNGPTIPA